MTTQNYLMVNQSTNVVDNVCVWDGNTDTWQPPLDYLMLIESTTLALIWQPILIDQKLVDWELVEQIGAGDIGFIWNSTTQVLTTNQPKPPIPEPKPPIPTQS